MRKFNAKQQEQWGKYQAIIHDLIDGKCWPCDWLSHTSNVGNIAQMNNPY